MFANELSSEEEVAVARSSRSRSRDARSTAGGKSQIAARAASPGDQTAKKCTARAHARVASGSENTLRPSASKQHRLRASAISSGPGVSLAGGKQPRPHCVGRTTGKWLDVLFDVMRRLGHEPAPSLPRPLVLHTMHTGTGSFHTFFSMAGIKVHDTVGAEKKVHAHLFAEMNRVAPHMFWTSTDDMLLSAISPEDDKYIRADIFHSGWPSQPFTSSAMTRRTRQTSKPCDRPVFKEFDMMCQYITKTEPKACLLESTTSFAPADSQKESVFDGQTSCQAHRDIRVTGISLLRQNIGSKYHIAHAVINTECWIDIRRPRLVMWCLHKDFGSEADCVAAATLAEQIQLARQQTTPEVVEWHLLDQSSEAGAAVHVDIVERGHLRCNDGPDEAGEKKRKRAWEKEVLHIRKWIRDQGCEWVDEGSLGQMQCRGLARTERQLRVLEVVLMTHCHLNNLDPRSEDDLRLAKQGLKWDVSQNIDHLRIKAFRGCPPSCVCRGVLLYSFEADRLVHPVELLSCFGWPSHVKYGDISWSKLTDLLGESQALQAIGVSTLAMLTAFAKSCQWT